MSKTKTPKRWRINVQAELDIDAITGAARDVKARNLALGDIHGLLLHEVRVGSGRTEISASTSAAGARAAADNLKARSGAKVKVVAARAATRR